MNKLSLNNKLSRNHNVAFTEIDSDLVMMGPNNNLFYGVNSVGTHIWSLLEFDTLSLNDICEHIHDSFEVTETQCVDDVTQFVEEMIAQRLLVVTT